MGGPETQATASFAEIKPFRISLPLSSFQAWQDSLLVDTKSKSKSDVLCNYFLRSG